MLSRVEMDCAVMHPRIKIHQKMFRCQLTATIEQRPVGLAELQIKFFRNTIIEYRTEFCTRSLREPRLQIDRAIPILRLR